MDWLQMIVKNTIFPEHPIHSIYPILKKNIEKATIWVDKEIYRAAFLLETWAWLPRKL